jgi:hypothetical protein
MRSFTMHDGNRFRFVSYGNGLAYLLSDKQSKRSLHVQGDDASELERTMDGIEAAQPTLTYAEVLAWLWDQCDYQAMADQD